jgi:2-polyprenyl-3-methyl-5-hydroxy-6-metoxy-1,4-benzoquinol methylase
MNNNFIQRKICPVCNGNQFHTLLSIPFTNSAVFSFITTYYKGNIPEEIFFDVDFKLQACLSCDLIFQENILSEENMFLLYEKWISSDTSLKKRLKASFDFFSAQSASIQSIIKLTKKNPNEIKAMEYGMGWGLWLRMAKAFGLHAVGCELSDSRIQFAQESGLTVVSELSDIQANSLDFIYSNQVFEHLSNPLETLITLSKLLRSGGFIQISVPQGILAKWQLMLPEWNARKDALHPLEHINCYKRSTLKVLAGKAGLKPIRSPYIPEVQDFKSFLKSTARHFYYSTLGTTICMQKD